MSSVISPGELLQEIGCYLKSVKAFESVQYFQSAKGSWKIHLADKNIKIFKHDKSLFASAESKDFSDSKWKRNLTITIENNYENTEESPTNEEKILNPHTSAYGFSTMGYLH